uniref:Glutathione S-transferase n=1 Tax=Quercus lobata TaxID=97700 RepID=A0A7N2L9S1_QUELO
MKAIPKQPPEGDASKMGSTWRYGAKLVQGVPEERQELADHVVDGLFLLEEAFGKYSKGKGFFLGDRIGFIDIAFGSLLGWLRVTEKAGEVKLLDEGKTPGLVKWAESFCADAAVKSVMPETEKLIEFSKLLMAKMKGAPPKN